MANDLRLDELAPGLATLRRNLVRLADLIANEGRISNAVRHVANTYLYGANNADTAAANALYVKIVMPQWETEPGVHRISLVGGDPDPGAPAWLKELRVCASQATRLLSDVACERVRQDEADQTARRLRAIAASLTVDCYANEPIPPEQTNHSDDFTSVNWSGTHYTFSKGQQAEAVKVLWEQWDAGKHGLSQETIGVKVGSSSDRFRLAHTFRRKNSKPHPAWGTMIQEVSKGVYALKPPAGSKW